MNTRLFLLALLLPLSLTACNVFEGLHEEGENYEPSAILEDARVASQEGRFDDAVDYLERAHDRQPENIEIRVELASALLTLNEIDVLLIAELADEIEGDERQASKITGCPDDLQCSFDCGAARSARPFSYRDSDAYLRVENALHVLEQVNELVGVPLAEIGAVPEDRTYPEADRKQLFDTLVAKIAETHPHQKARRMAATLLLDASIASIATILAEIEQSAASSEITLYHVEGEDGAKTIEYCGKKVDEFIAGTMCPVITSAEFTLDMLKARVENFTSDGTSQRNSIATELIDAGHELFDGLKAGVGSSCD